MVQITEDGKTVTLKTMGTKQLLNFAQHGVEKLPVGYFKSEKQRKDFLYELLCIQEDIEYETYLRLLPKVKEMLQEYINGRKDKELS